ncbi:chemotaxis response regulator protein-glutamate methylesterase [Paramagnetospirillum caucaseum]|uniref:Chemotaxis response regulator protein-glutamate methylesterase n=1 Tax=Paramagnetospirillum caucaseum TaxID=1244869 RepID=M3AG88_9PROT|nr:SpoIIE family protein phosphatase [Paramagnetospirillum caucaseum]EME71574.1 chemotaxis response regulator protein-glutamate methylesterase [Paramagnetospirillum caucaseum]
MTIVAVMDGISPQAEEHLRLLGWPVAAEPGDGHGAVMVRERFPAGDLAGCLSPPWAGGIEVGGTGLHPVGSCFRRHLAEGGLGLSLRSDTAYGGDVALPFAQAVGRRLAEPEGGALEFIIQEMVTNALLHGNLMVGGIDSDGGGGLDGFGERIEAALADSERAGRRVQLSASLVGDRLELAVEDDGPGFDHPDSHANSRRPHGLALLESMVSDLRIEEGGRRTVATLVIPTRQLRPEPPGLESVRVLVVDDNLMNRVLMETLLLRMGVGRVETVESGEKGLAAIAREKPDLILLDVMMPGMDGFEMCRQLRRRHPLTELPVIFVTALDGPADRTACFQAGGSDMVTKPIDAHEVAARVGVHLRLGQAMDGLKAYRERVHEELRAARAAQAALMPTSAELSAIRGRLGLVVDGRIESSSELGGDFWTVLPAGPNQMTLLVADFTGHGPVAAFNVFRLHLLLSRLPRQMPSPSALLGHLNLELKAVLRPGQFAAAFAALIDVEAGTLTYAGAASPPPVLVSGGAARFLEADGPPLGAFADAEYEETRIGLPCGAALLAYSDALVESLGDDGALACDQESLREWVQGVRAGHSLADEVLARFREKVPGEPPDDLTLVCIRRP